MSTCLQTIADYGLRSIGIGERLLPRTDFTLCQQFTLIGSGMIWNIYFGVLALAAGLMASQVSFGHSQNRAQSDTLGLEVFSVHAPYLITSTIYEPDPASS